MLRDLAQKHHVRSYRKTAFPVALFLVLTTLAPGAQPRPTLPTVTSYSLDKAKVTLPDELAGQHNVLILYFEPNQSEAAVAWATALQPVKYANPGMQSYILPVYPRENFLYRWWIDTSLRSSATPAQEWRTTIPIFVDKNKFLSALDIRDEKQFVVLLTDKAGRVEWRTEGPLNDTKLASLVAAFTTVTTLGNSHIAGFHSAGH
jgi:hypothetical protein